MRIVLDTVALVRALINPYSRWGRLVFDYADRYELVVSPAVVAEYLSVLRRPELTEKYRSVATRNPSSLLDFISTAHVVQPQELVAICRDPADDKFLDLAKAAAADFIVTADADLLDLGAFEGTAIITAETFLRLIEQSDPPKNAG